MYGAAICQVRDSRNARARSKAARERGDSALYCAPASIVHLRRIISWRRRAYLTPSRAALRRRTPLLDSGGTGSLQVLAVPRFRKVPRLAPTSVVPVQATIPETKCSKGSVCRRCTNLAVSFARSLLVWRPVLTKKAQTRGRLSRSKARRGPSMPRGGAVFEAPDVPLEHLPESIKIKHRPQSTRTSRKDTEPVDLPTPRSTYK